VVVGVDIEQANTQNAIARQSELLIIVTPQIIDAATAPKPPS